MSKLGKRLIDAADEALSIARGKADPATYRTHVTAELLEERKRRRAALHAAIERGIADIEAGRVHDADIAFHELEARNTRMLRASARKAKK
jgi:antitoxin ParD1/3/4